MNYFEKKQKNLGEPLFDLTEHQMYCAAISLNVGGLSMFV